jgi:hypothetical protein
MNIPEKPQDEDKVKKKGTNVSIVIKRCSYYSY